MVHPFVVIRVFFLWRCDPNRAEVGSFPRFLYHTQFSTHTHTHTHTHCRTPLNEWSAPRRMRYLHSTQQTQDTDKRTLSGDSNPRFQQSNGRRPTPQTARPLRTAFVCTQTPTHLLKSTSSYMFRPSSNCEQLYHKKEKVKFCAWNYGKYRSKFLSRLRCSYVILFKRQY